jgi:Protein of unknown function (DUF3306)
MSDEEFLRRWSRRKQEARATEHTQPSLPAEEAGATPPPATGEVASEPAIDLSKLPPLDSITAATDITEFLRKGIPGELSRAALRRAWAADPAIRDFVGLAENAWDFTDPNAMPGFGALHDSPEQIGAMVERVLGGMREAAEKLAPEDRGDAQENPIEAETARFSPTSETAPDAVASSGALSSESAESAVATQPETPADERDEVPFRRRTHGGALPR